MLPRHARGVLPETPDGIRNWDYRYCWLRDATFTLLALMASGFHQGASAWRAWLRRAVAGDPAQVQIMYGIAGERRLYEWLVPWLSGYGGSRPVRIGNAAAGQLQIDIYGEVMDALFQASVGLREHPEWDLQCALVEHLGKIWEEPDDGIWDSEFFFGRPQRFATRQRCYRRRLGGPIGREKRRRIAAELRYERPAEFRRHSRRPEIRPSE